MKVTPIDHHWLHDLPLTTYDPRLVERTQIDNSQLNLTAQGVLVSVFFTWDESHAFCHEAQSFTKNTETYLLK